MKPARPPTTTLRDPEWDNTSVVGANLADKVREIKEQPGGDIITYGFGPVAMELLRHGLLDEIRLAVHPVLAGVGNGTGLLFQEGRAAKLTLPGTRPLGSGVVILSYRAAA